MADRNVGVSCASCGQEQRIMKRCTRCLQIFYCSRECQVKDWPMHKVSCERPTRKPAGCILENKPCDHCEIRKSEFGMERKESLCAEIQESIAASCVQMQGMNNVTTTAGVNAVKSTTYDLVETNLHVGDSKANQKQTEVPCNNTNKQDIDNPGAVMSVNVLVKHNKSKHRLRLPSDSGVAFQMISDFLHIPASQLKLIHKGKMVTKFNIGEILYDTSLFLAFGEVSENEEGLIENDIDIIVRQLAVERNVAIRSLRKTGNVVDAILEIGNR